MNPPRPNSRQAPAPTFKSRFETAFVSLFTSHPFAKILSVALAVALVFLIDRELREPIFEERMRIVTEGPGGKLEILVEVPPGYVIIAGPNELRPVSVTIQGVRKEAEKIKTPFKAVIPAERFVQVTDSGPALVSLEPKDLRIGGLTNPKVEMEPVQIPVAREITRVIELAAIPETPIAADRQLSVTFIPASVAVTGPAHVVEPLPKISLAVPVPKGDSKEEHIFSELPAELRRQRMKWPRGVQVVAEVQSQLKDVTAFKARVRIVVDQKIDNPEFEYQFEEINRYGTTVELSGPNSEVKEIEKDLERKQRLEERLYLVVLADLAAKQADPPLTKEWQTLSLSGSIPKQLLDELQLVGPKTEIPINIKARRR